MNEQERTPEQLRADRKAGLGCAGLLLAAGIASVVMGIVFLSPPPGEKTEARILSCDLRVPRQPFRCNGLWRIGGEFKQGYVEGASEDDIGKRIEVRAEGDAARAVRGRGFTAIGSFALAAFLLFCAVGIGRSALRKRPPG